MRDERLPSGANLLPVHPVEGQAPRYREMLADEAAKLAGLSCNNPAGTPTGALSANPAVCMSQQPACGEPPPPMATEPLNGGTIERLRKAADEVLPTRGSSEWKDLKFQTFKYQDDRKSSRKFFRGDSTFDTLEAIVLEDSVLRGVLHHYEIAMMVVIDYGNAPQVRPDVLMQFTPAP